MKIDVVKLVEDCKKLRDKKTLNEHEVDKKLSEFEKLVEVERVRRSQYRKCLGIKE